MTLVKCPFCAEDVQDVAILCRHCGQSLATPSQTPSAKPKDDILAVYEAGKTGGSYFAMLCLQDAIVVRQTISLATGMTMMLLSVLGLLFYVVPGIIVILATLGMRKSRFKAVKQYKTRQNLPPVHGDVVISFTAAEHATLVKGKGILAPCIEISTATGCQKYFLQDRSAFEPLRAMFPQLPVRM